MQPEKISNNTNCLIYDSWLTEILKKESYQVNGCMKDFKDRDFLSPLFLKKPVFAYAEVPVQSISEVKFFEELGFHLINTRLCFSRQKGGDHYLYSEYEIRFAIPEDEEKVVKLAYNNIRFSRFHLDPEIPGETANYLKGEWARGYFLGKRGDQMVVALDGKEVIGFLQLILRKERVLIIDLIAVDEKKRRQGIARNMVLFAETNLEDIRELQAGTQVANIPSICLYEKLGFRMQEASYIFHYHSEE